jgi:O-antigen ligase
VKIGLLQKLILFNAEQNTMTFVNITSAAVFFLAAGIFTSVSILSGYQVLIVLPMVYFVYQAIKNKQFKLPVSAWFLLAFAVVAIVSLLINIDIVPKPSKNFGRVQYFFYGVAGIFAFRDWIGKASDKAKKVILSVFYLNVLIAAGYAFYTAKFVVANGRANGLTETMRYGYGSAMILVILLSAILNHDKIKSWFNPKVAAIFLIIGFYGMYLTYTRGALLGFLCALPFVMYFYRPKLGLIFGGICTLLVTCVGLYYLFGTTKFESRLLMNKSNDSDNIRMSQWKAAVIATQERPVLGWGLSNFHTQLKRIKYQYDLEAKEYDDAHSHNLFLEVASGTGLIGLFLFLGWIVSWAIEAYKAKGLYRALIVPFGAVFVISSQFEVTFDANNATMIFFLYALSSASTQKEKSLT